eukprot:m.107431 g.107431  ORF g.107431 m.107431 type:complete len:349 (-) comp13927_c0_seq4:264-1310(-)
MRWYPGTIAKSHGDGTFDVLYDDGDTEYGLPKQRVRPTSDSSAVPVIRPPIESTCLGCAMNHIFHEIYSGSKSQFSPHKLLYAVWQHSHHLAGYSQQDAHEFFIALLDGMHTHLGGLPGTCDCIIHRIFTGALQSDVTCTKCNTVSTKIDPFWDISLDIMPIAHMPSPNKVATDLKEQETPTLTSCLERYTRTESLMANILCSKCATREPATKQMSIHKLPAVICLHLKRFEHESRAAKISTHVKFTEQLDMRPFLSPTVREEINEKTKTGREVDDSCIYSLFSVVNHHGTLQHGHYTNYVRVPGDTEWFLCEDDNVSMAKLSDVLSSEGYMLFYVKKVLAYSNDGKS